MVTFLDNFILGLALTIPLGPVILEILRRGLKLGLFESIKTISGVFSAELIYFFLAYFGVSKIMEYQGVGISLGLLGVGFLLYLGYENVLDFFNGNSGNGLKSIYKNSFAAGFLIAFLNPFVLFLWVGIIGGFMAQSASFLIMTGVLFGSLFAYAIVATVSKIGNKIVNEKSMKYISLIAGMFLIYYGIRLLSNILGFLTLQINLLIFGIIMELCLLKKVLGFYRK